VIVKSPREIHCLSCNSSELNDYAIIPINIKSCIYSSSLLRLKLFPLVTNFKIFSSVQFVYYVTPGTINRNVEATSSCSSTGNITVGAYNTVEILMIYY
jgi:hypothetical protein